MPITGYEDQQWSGGTPIDGEQLSSNGRYTGQKLGSPAQDKIDPASSEDPYYVEHSTPHMGTITQDAAADANMPTKTTAPEITTASLPGGTVSTEYNQTLAATGSKPITWEVTSGNLPAGLELDSGTGAISGTPTTDETATFTVTAANSAGSASKELSITISAA